MAFLSRAIYFGIELYKIYDVSSANDDETRQEFSAALTESILYIPWNVLPISFIYYTHYRTFSVMAEEGEDEHKRRSNRNSRRGTGKKNPNDTMIMLSVGTSH